MMNRRQRLTLALALAGVLVSVPVAGWAAKLKKGDALPAFTFRLADGQILSHETAAQADLSVLYFFSTTCRTCADGLRRLEEFKSVPAHGEVLVLGIGKQSAEELAAFLQPLGVSFPVFPGTEELLESFGVSAIFPITYVVGPGGVILKQLQGGGASTAALLTTIAERQLARQNAESARQLFTQAEQAGDDSGTAVAGTGHALLVEGKLAEAEQTFQRLAQSGNPELAVKGHEGLAEVYLRQGKVAAAQEEAEKVLQRQPDNVVAQRVKGEVLYQAGQKEEARAVLAAATDGGDATFDFQQAQAHIAMGNLAFAEGEPELALVAFEEAAKAEPLSVEALSNKGVVLQEMGEPEKALETFQKVASVNPNDALVASLIRQAQAAIAQKQDLERQRYIDSLVDDLVERFRENRAAPRPENADDWTSPALSVSILGFQNEESGLLGRLGMEGVLMEELIQALQSRGINVVDRAIIDKVLEELKLGSSELADPDTALRLGRIMAARLIATGSVFGGAPNGTVTLRLIDTETTKLVLANSVENAKPSQIAAAMADRIVETIHQSYPLKGRLALVENDTVIVNLGSKHGVKPGTVFNVLGESQPIVLNGRVLGERPSKLGKLQVESVEELMAIARPVERTGTWDVNMRVIQAQ